MVNLPVSSKLNISALSRVFNDMSESYKVFWFNGILQTIKNQNKKTTFREIISTMIVSAWYMVSEYHLNLGPSDTLEKLVLRAISVSGLKSTAKPEEIHNFLFETDDNEIKNAMSTLTLNVPYRIHAPFMSDFKGSSWNKTKNVVDRINADDTLIYSFGYGRGLDMEIIIRDDWFDYIYANQSIINGWLEYNTIMYLQKRNPNVPGIVNKLYPPEERKLDDVRRFWKVVANIIPIENIYTNDGSLLNNDISIDHFVPWS